MARQGYGNAQFEVDGEEGEVIVEEFYTQDARQQDQKQMPDFRQVQEVQKGLQQSVSAVS